MESPSVPTRASVDRAAASDARLAVTAVVTAVLGFATLVVLPYAVAGFAPPAGTDVLWRVGGPLAVVLAAATSLLALLRDSGPDGTTRRLHEAVLVIAATFAAFLVSPSGQSVLRWWQD